MWLADVYLFAAAVLGEVELRELRAWIDARLEALAPDDGLTAREEQVVRLIAQGYSNKDIAGRMELSVKTVETFKARAMEKLHISTRVELVRYAARRGWLAT